MGANGSFDKKIGCVPASKRSHVETGYTVMGHKVLLQGGKIDQTKNVMNSNSANPIYLMAKQNKDGTLTILNVNCFSDHQIVFEVNLKFDNSGNVIPFNGKETASHAHEWCSDGNGVMARKYIEGNSHLPIPTELGSLINAVQSFNNQKYRLK